VATGNKLTETFGEVLKRNNACSGIKPLVSRCGSHKTKHTQWPKQLPKTGNNICVHIYILGLKIADGECWHGISQDIVCTQRQMNCHEVRTAKKKRKAAERKLWKVFGVWGCKEKRNPRSVKAKPIFERLAILHIKVIKYLLQNVSLLFPRHMSLPQMLAADAVADADASIPVSIPIAIPISIPHIYPHLYPFTPLSMAQIFMNGT